MNIKFVRMAFRLCNTLATYQRAMNFVLKDLLWQVGLAYLDDVVVLGRTFEEHLENICQVLLCFRKYNVKNVFSAKTV